MTNETKPVLLTEAEWRSLIYAPDKQKDGLIGQLRERGLIAPSPVDALLIEAREICIQVCEGHAGQWSEDVRAGKRDDYSEIRAALAALRRGMELAKPELTREMVREAVNGISYEVFECGSRDTIADRLHAALQGQSK